MLTNFGHPNVTFKIVDWDQRVEYFARTSAKAVKSFEFDMSMRIASASTLLSSGKVVITDRLHGSIFSFLMKVPHVYIDQVSRKVTLTREVAFAVHESCRQAEAIGYAAADGVEDAVGKALKFLGH